ncbi:MAG: type II toxin-antitoxin system VapB family antitoxin [Phycisphaerales bacterium]
MHMRTTVILRDDLIERARQLTGIKRKTDLLHAGLEALITREVQKRLAAMAGSDPKAKAGPRRRGAA